VLTDPRPGGKGRVSVVTLATGESTAIVDADTQNDLRTIPVWRRSGELCLIVPAGSEYGSPTRSELVLWSQGKATVLSKRRPDDVVAGLK
jgi:hypothetical protein